MKNKKKAESLLKERGWDGKYPIPVVLKGNVKQSDLNKIGIVNFSGDDQCLWITNAESALILLDSSHELVKDSTILAKKDAFLKNPIFKKSYPHWYE